MLFPVWRNALRKKTYINGGNAALYTGISPYGVFNGLHGAKTSPVHQAYGYEYQLPNITAYNETCGALGDIGAVVAVFGKLRGVFSLVNLAVADIKREGELIDLIARVVDVEFAPDVIAGGLKYRGEAVA